MVSSLGKFWNKTVLLSVVLILSASFQASAKPTHLYTYKECVDMALRNNDQIRAVSQEMEIAKGKSLEAHPIGKPVFKYEHRLAPVPRNIDEPSESFFSGDISVFNNFKLEVGVPLLAFGKLRTAQALAEIGIDAAWFKKRKTSDEIILKVYQTFEGVVLARELLSLADSAMKTIAQKVDSLESASTKDQLQILKMKVTKYEVERKVQEAKKKEKLALAALKVLVGVDEEADFGIQMHPLAPVAFRLGSLGGYNEQARDYMPEFKLLQAGVAAKEKKLKLEKIDPVPALGVGGLVDLGYAPGISGGTDQNNFTNPFNFKRFAVGFQLKGEFNPAMRRAKVRQAEADLLKTIYEKRAATNGLNLDVKKTFLDVKEAQILMKHVAEEKKAAQQIVFLTKSNFDIGIGEKKDYFDALQSFQIFQGREFEAIYNFNVAVATLKQKVGILYSEQKKENP